MNKLPKDKRDKIIMVAAGTVVAVVALWFVLIKPLRAQAAAITQQAVESRATVAKGQRTLVESNKVATALSFRSGQIKEAEGAMASGDLYSWMIQTMNQFKLDQNVDIPQISREIPCEVGVFPQFPYKAATFVVNGSAYFHDFGKFLAAFENHFPYMRVQNLELEPGGNAKAEKTEDNERLRFKMEFVTLIKPVAP